MAQALMVQGTSSHVGKSVLVAALCRIFKRQGVNVAPFKAQNMALNSFITPEGGEIGRAQAYQAEAAGIPPSVLMNPILLKANSDTGAQVIVKGRVKANMGVREYHAFKDEAFKVIEECYRELASRHDLIIIEGAGSPAEINLKDNDLVNMRTAKMAGARVLIAADIDRGGVFASILGTMEILDPDERELVAGFIINKFRGDATLLDSGLEFVRRKTGRPVVGVIPYFKDIYIQEEDGVALEGARGLAGLDDGAVDVAVLRLGHISNFTDFDPLANEPDVRVRYVRGVEDFGRPDLLIIPGSKNTVGDLLELRASGLERKVIEYHRSGGRVAGICGGYQMLGRMVHDPHGVETANGSVAGLGLLDAETVLLEDKVTAQVEAEGLSRDFGAMRGYEIHMGRTALGEGASPLFRITKKSGEPAGYQDGAVNGAGTAWGTYMHGVFDNDLFRREVIETIRSGKGSGAAPGINYSYLKEEGLERLADTVEKNLDMGFIMGLLERKSLPIRRFLI